MIDPSTCFLFQADVLSSLEVRASWTVPADLPYFDGHFPNMPVLPAVAIIDASAELLRRALRRETLKPLGVPAAKFLRPIQPGQNLEISAQGFSASEWSVEWRESGTGHTLATLRLKL